MADNNQNRNTVCLRQKQWASRVVEYSSQYNDSTWSANQVIGPPKVYPRHGDITGAWAQGNRAANEFITVEFPRAFYPEQIDIYETYNPGAVVRVSIRNSLENTTWQTVWEVEAPHIESRSRIFSIPCRNHANQEINQVRLDVNCTAANNWCEIDAIELIGHPSLRDANYKELTSQLGSLLIDDSLSDISFELDDGTVFNSYRNLLSCRSFYLESIIQENSIDTTRPIRIENISRESFYQILHFIFTDHIEPILSYKTCLELLRKADRFHLGFIYNQAFEVLKKVITKSNVLEIFISSGLFPDPSLTDDDNLFLPDVIDYCVDFVQKNRREIYCSDQLKQLSREALVELVQRVQ